LAVAASFNHFDQFSTAHAQQQLLFLVQNVKSPWAISYFCLRNLVALGAARFVRSEKRLSECKNFSYQPARIIIPNCKLEMSNKSKNPTKIRRTEM